MASDSVHYRQLVASSGTPENLQSILKSKPHKYDTKKGVGFLMSKTQVLNGFSTRLVFPKTVKAKKVDPSDLTSSDFLTQEWTVNFATDIEFDFGRKLAMVVGSRSGFKVIEEKISEIDKVSAHFADLDVDVIGVLHELQKQYPKTAVERISVKNYLDKSAYRANVTFKADPKSAQTAEFIKKHASQIHTIQIKIMQPDEVYSIKFNKKGSVTFSAKGKDGEWPEFLYGYMADLIKHFNAIDIDGKSVEEPEVEGEKSSHLKLVTPAA